MGHSLAKPALELRSPEVAAGSGPGAGAAGTTTFGWQVMALLITPMLAEPTAHACARIHRGPRLILNSAVCCCLSQDGCMPSPCLWLADPSQEDCGLKHVQHTSMEGTQYGVACQSNPVSKYHM